MPAPAMGNVNQNISKIRTCFSRRIDPRYAQRHANARCCPNLIKVHGSSAPRPLIQRVSHVRLASFCVGPRLIGSYRISLPLYTGIENVGGLAVVRSAVDYVLATDVVGVVLIPGSMGSG